jgi:hypothetical protein
MEPESTQKSEGESTNIPVNVVNSTPPSADSQTKAADEPQPEPSTPPASASPTPIVSKDKDPRRRRKLLLIGGLIIVLAAAGAAYWVNHNHKVTAPKVTVIKRAHKSPMSTRSHILLAVSPGSPAFRIAFQVPPETS